MVPTWSRESEAFRLTGRLLAKARQRGAECRVVTVDKGAEEEGEAAPLYQGVGGALNSSRRPISKGVGVTIYLRPRMGVGEGGEGGLGRGIAEGLKKEAGCRQSATPSRSPRACLKPLLYSSKPLGGLSQGGRRQGTGRQSPRPSISSKVIV